MILSLLLASTLQAYAANYFYSCYQVGNISTHLPRTFLLEQKDSGMNLKDFLYKLDYSLGLVDITKSKAYYELETSKYLLYVAADSRLRTGGFKTPEGTYVGTLEVTYDDYREEYIQAYFCKRRAVTAKK